LLAEVDVKLVNWPEIAWKQIIDKQFRIL